MKEIERLQKYLMILRMTANWSVHEFAELLDVTRQTINNLESNKTKMSKVQYLAIRSCFSYEIEKNNNQTLAKLLYCLVDYPEKMTEKDRNFILQQAKILSLAIKGGSSKYDASESLKQALLFAGIAIVPVVVEAVSWMETIMREKRK